MRKLLGIAVVLLVGLPLFFFGAAPLLTDLVLNRRGSQQGKAGTRRATELVHDAHVVDLHADTLLWGRDVLTRSWHGHVDLPRLQDANVLLQAFTVVTRTPRLMRMQGNADDTDNISLLALAQRWPAEARQSVLQRALYQARNLREAADRSGGQLRLVRTAADIDDLLARRARGEKVVGALLGLEGAQALEGKLENLPVLQDAGFRMMAPTHFTDTQVSGSAHGTSHGGLTQLGRAWVAEMEKRELLIDLAHASPKTIDDVLALATRPLVVSHTGVKGTCDNPRNLSDAHLRGIATTGGVIGIAYFKAAVCGTDAAAIARALVHAVKVAGETHVALGSDFDGAVATPFDTTGIPLVAEELLKQGLTPAQVRLVLGDNALRVLRAALPQR